MDWLFINLNTSENPPYVNEEENDYINQNNSVWNMETMMDHYVFLALRAKLLKYT